MRSRNLLFIMLLMLVPVWGMTATYYVSPLGDNANEGSQVNPWKTIQYAINTSVVVSGDTIQVAAGTYNERIYITKSLTFLGATQGVSKKGYSIPVGYAYDNTQETIITPSTDSAGALMFVRADNVILDGFIICNMVNAGGYPRELIYLDQQNLNYLNVKIINNVIGPNTNTTSQTGGLGRSGITVAGPTNTLRKLYIANNKIFKNDGDGCGIMFVATVGVKNVNNSIDTHNTFAGTVIENNEISGNHRAGIELSGGVQGGETPEDYVIIRNNIINDNGKGFAADDANLKYGNGITMIRVGSDSYYDDAHGSRYMLITENEIKGNEKNGIYMGSFNKDIYIKGNLIENNGAGMGTSTWDGIRIDMNECYYATPKNVTYSANDPYAPGGPYAYPTTILMSIYTTYSELSNIRIQGNNIQGNTLNGLWVTEEPVQGNVLATYNYWGAADGPLPAGTGNNVSSYVDYNPFSSITCKAIGANIDAGSSEVPLSETGISFDFTGGNTGTGGDIMVALAFTHPSGDTPGGAFNSNNSLTRVWSLITDMTGFNVTLIFSYEDADIPLGVNEASLIPLRSTDGGLTWEDVPGSILRDTVNNTITISGVTGFSLWAFGDSGMVPVELSDFISE